jgi:hypothetical protein
MVPEYGVATTLSKHFDEFEKKPARLWFKLTFQIINDEYQPLSLTKNPPSKDHWGRVYQRLGKKTIIFYSQQKNACLSETWTMKLDYLCLTDPTVLMQAGYIHEADKKKEASMKKKVVVTKKKRVVEDSDEEIIAY